MKKIFIIAEAGVNHNGSMEIAKKLVDVAAKAGADAVKFQTFRVKNLLCEKTKKPEYQVRHCKIVAFAPTNVSSPIFTTPHATAPTERWEKSPNTQSCSNTAPLFIIHIFPTCASPLTTAFLPM